MVVSLSDQKLVANFLAEWKESVVEKCGGQIDFILLFGSAVRGEFIRGHSDVDLIIQTNQGADVAPVTEIALAEFWRLDEKWGMRFREVCSIGTGENQLDSLLKLLESNARLYKPFEVFGPDDIDWKKGHILRKDLHWGAFWVASQLSLFYKMKTEGRILFGRNILQEIKPTRSVWEKFKALIIPQHLAFAGVLLSLVLPKRAIGYATKSVLWELESALIVRNQFQPDRNQQIDSLNAELNSVDFDVAFFSWKKFAQNLQISILSQDDIGRVLTCIQTKKNSPPFSRVQAFLFCWKSLFWVLKVRFWTSLKELVYPSG